MKRWQIGWLSAFLFALLFFSLFSFSSGNAQSELAASNPYILRIKITDCAHAPVERRQTGFLVEGEIGVVTALHGLVDCHDIRAVSADGTMTLTAMRLHSVDVARDIAVLWSPDLETEQLAGLEPSTQSLDALADTPLELIAYPFGLATQTSHPLKPPTSVQPLDLLIPVDESYVPFIQRESPSLDTTVLKLATNLQPGEAGAPLLDQDGTVVAVAGGGLKTEDGVYSWAIPWAQVDLQSYSRVEVQAAVDLLAAMVPTDSLAVLTTFPALPDSGAGFLSYTVRVVGDRVAGDAAVRESAGSNTTDDDLLPIANAELTLSHSGGYEIKRTDADGYYTFWLSKAFDYRDSILLIEAAGYDQLSHPVEDLADATAIDEVQLAAIQPTATATPVPPPTATPSPTNENGLPDDAICEFAYLIVDSIDFAAIGRARIATTIGGRHDVGFSDSLGFYRGRLPCEEGTNRSSAVVVTKMGYLPHEQTIILVGETKEISLIRSSTPTPTATATPRATATPTKLPNATPCGSTINPYDLTARQRAGVACPAQGWVAERIVEVQEFEGGFMIVFDDPANDNFQQRGKQRKSYLLANDGRAWRVYFGNDDMPQLRSSNVNDWYSCEPQGGDSPAVSGVPWRRFGLIWCTYDQIRAAFGRALTDEITMNASFQSYYEGRVFQLAGEETVYIIYLDADDETIEDRYLTGIWEARNGGNATPRTSSGTTSSGTTSSGTSSASSTPSSAGNTVLKAEVERVCNDTKGQVWFAGTVNADGKPLDGYRVQYKSAKVAGNDPVASVIIGPSDQHRDWKPGYFEQFVDIVASTASPKSLQVWVTNPGGRKVSEDAFWDSDGSTGKCNHAVIKFDTP